MMATKDGSVLTETQTRHNASVILRALTPQDVHIWAARLDEVSLRLDEMQRCLSPDEVERAARFRFAADQVRYVAGRAVLRRLLAQYTGVSPAALTFVVGAAGKPALAHSPLRFNLSHSGDLAVYAFALGREVGIDVERVNANVPVETLSERFFTNDEYHALMALPPERRASAFARLWTCKEAYIKARGGGFAIPLDSFEVVGPDLSARRSVRTDAVLASRWQITPLSPGDGYAAALVTEGDRPRVTLYEWPWDCF